MALCTFEQEHGSPPESCAYLKSWLWNLVQDLVAVDTIRCAVDTADPVAQDLEDLWGTCDVPPGGFVVWYNSVSAETLYYICPEGSAVGCSWTEVTLS